MSIGSTNMPGMNITELFNSGIDNVGKRGEALQARMNELLSQEEVGPEEMMMVQFEMGQYNALMESLSSVTKSLTDSLKSLAQRAG